jgi:integrase
MHQTVFRFLNSREHLGKYTPATAKLYREYLVRFFEITKIREPTEITIEHVERFDRSIAGEASAKNNGLKAVKAYLKYCQNRLELNVMNPDRIEFHRVNIKHIPTPSKIEIGQLLDHLLSLHLGPERQSTVKLYRDRALVAFIYDTACRRIECVTLERDRLNLPEGTAIVKGKGGNDRPVFFSKQTAFLLQLYFEVRPDRSSPWVFGSTETHGAQLRADAVSRIFLHRRRQYRLVDTLTPHRTRKRRVTEWLENGMPVHDSVTVSQRYYDTSVNRLKEVHEKFTR